MKVDFTYIEEPLLDFANGSHVCPRAGIAAYDVYDANNDPRRDDIFLGAVGTNENIDILKSWLEKNSKFIPRKNSNQPNLFPAFIGFNKQSGYSTEFVISDTNIKALLKKEVSETLKIKNPIKRIEAAVELFSEKIRFLAQNKTPEVIICVIPDGLYDKISTQRIADGDQVEDHLNDIETNFRRML